MTDFPENPCSEFVALREAKYIRWKFICISHMPSILDLEFWMFTSILVKPTNENNYIFMSFLKVFQEKKIEIP